jgi:hypothetical protein
MKNRMLHEKDHLTIEFPHYFTVKSKNWHDKIYRDKFLTSIGADLKKDFHVPYFVDKLFAEYFNSSQEFKDNELRRSKLFKKQNRKDKAAGMNILLF